MQGLQRNFQFSKIFNVLKDKEHNFNVPYLKEYISSKGDKKYKLTIMKSVKNSLVEAPKQKRGLVHTQKLDGNISRSRATIYEYAYCNKWDYFFTGTLDKTKANREDLKEFNARFKNFIKNFNTKWHCKVAYLIIPELHSDLKSWHFHGFVFGIPETRIREFKIGDKMR